MCVDLVPPGCETASTTATFGHTHHWVASISRNGSAQLCALDKGYPPGRTTRFDGLGENPGVLPFEVYAQAPLRLISWCSFEPNQAARRLLRELAVLCEEPTTTTEDLVAKIALRNTQVGTEHEASQYLATLATVHIASRAQMPTYTTMVQHFLGTLPLPVAIYMLDYWGRYMTYLNSMSFWNQFLGASECIV